MVIQWRITETEGTTKGPTGATDGDIMPIVTVSEIYDMNTQKDKIGLIGVHTPTRESIDKKWHGYFLNHKHYRILDCSVSIACASMLPLDPLGIGTGANQVAPQDIMNPILYRAVANDTWNTIVARLYSPVAPDVGDTDVNSVLALKDAFKNDASNMNQENLYYSLLASKEWRKAMPQQGLNMRGLRAFCYPIVSQFGEGALHSTVLVNNNPSVTGATAGAQSAQSPDYLPGMPQAVNAGTSNPNSPRYFRGRAQPLPRWPTCPGGIDKVSSADYSVNDQYHIVENNVMANVRAYVCAIVMPPMKLTSLYYRMKVSWRIAFDNPCSILENRPAYYGAQESGYYYKRSYDFEQPSTLSQHDSSAFDSADSSIESIGFEPKLVMDK